MVERERERECVRRWYGRRERKRYYGSEVLLLLLSGRPARCGCGCGFWCGCGCRGCGCGRPHGITPTTRALRTDGFYSSFDACPSYRLWGCCMMEVTHGMWRWQLSYVGDTWHVEGWQQLSYVGDKWHVEVTVILCWWHVACWGDSYCMLVTRGMWRWQLSYVGATVTDVGCKGGLYVQEEFICRKRMIWYDCFELRYMQWNSL